ncbi:MAG: DUF3616 domain-containing protein [Methylobacter sp.]|nr:DUF3616 domain-containing protein [Methylobacter sp.]
MNLNEPCPIVANNTQEKHYDGISNPSGAVALNSHIFIVADDENNLLRIYDRDVSDNPIQTIALSDLFKGQILDGEDLEMDLEGAADVDGTLFLIGSHSANHEGSIKPVRQRLFAVQITPDSNRHFIASPAGIIYTRLIADLEQDSRFDAYQFNKAKNLPPRTIGGLNIEGLAATTEKGLMIGFRNPLSGGKIHNGRLIKGKALLIPLLNPFEIISGSLARLGNPIELDLGGYGIRDIVLYKEQQYIIAAGPYHENEATPEHKREESRIYAWDAASGKLRHLAEIKLNDLNIEAAFFYPGEETRLHLLSDDGKRGRTKGFRSLLLKLSSL